MAINEDFSFPTLADTLSFSIDSPPLWTLSASSSPGNSSPQKEPIKRKENCHKLGAGLISKSSSTKAQRRSSSFVEYNKEEKMDMLWEDFNEELFVARRSCYDDAWRCESSKINMRCAESLRLCKKDVVLYNPKGSTNRVGLVVFIGVLKKFFLLQNSHRTANKRRRYFSWTS